MLQFATKKKPLIPPVEDEDFIKDLLTNINERLHPKEKGKVYPVPTLCLQRTRSFKIVWSCRSTSPRKVCQSVTIRQ